MRRSGFVRAVTAIAAAVALAGVVAGGPSCRGLRGPGDGPADVLYVNGTIVTMNDAGTVARCVATRGSEIACVGSGDSCCAAVRGEKTQVVDLQGATVLPGFIDSHSHLSGWGLLNDPEHWIDISSVNVLLKPLPGDPRCPEPNDYQRCFVPVQTQDDVVQRLKAAAASPSSAPILGLNYDPSRLGRPSGCKVDGGAAFQCPNFEDGTARRQLDAISTKRRILITSESGHINYVNTSELEALNICPPPRDGQPMPDAGACHMPIENQLVELKLAQHGQLNEDLALYATGAAVGELLGKDPLGGLVAAIRKAADVYARNGFTTVQEGAAAPGLAAAYVAASAGAEKLPVTVQLLIYDDTTNDLGKAVKAAQELRKLQNPSLRIAGLKQFADGSTQGYTGFLGAPYKQLFAPFTSKSIFPSQPYVGLPDTGRDALAADFQTAHDAGFPLMVHQNGDAAIANVLAALPPGGTSAGGPRDVMIHFAMASPEDLRAAKNAGAGVTFLTPDLYFYGQPMCHQILGRERTERLYPAGDAARAGLRFGLHSDTPVTPPVPLFMVWVAKTRKTQMMPWYPRHSGCPEVMGEAQAISILQGIKAFTIDAAYLYGLEDTLGSIEVGKTADLVQLSANPLSMEADPDGLKTIRILGTVHRGRFIPNPDAALPPIWPG